MIDFRYHAMSLAAVFVALAVGLLLGVTIGDTELLSNVRGDLERSLSADLDEARDENKRLKGEGERRDEFIRTVYPQLVAGRLGGERVAVVGSAHSTGGIVKPVTGSVEPASGRIAFAAELVKKPRYADLAAAIGADVGLTRGEPSSKQAEKLGMAVGRRIARGADLLPLRRLAFSKLSGKLRRTRLFAFVRVEPEALKTDEGRRLDAFERGVVAGLSRDAARVVGLEKSDTSPSNVKWFNSLGLSTVDNVEQYSGHYSFVLILTGAKGDYGYKKTADAMIPPVAP